LIEAATPSLEIVEGGVQPPQRRPKKWKPIRAKRPMKAISNAPKDVPVNPYR
jgi:hypothetical protein